MTTMSTKKMLRVVGLALALVAGAAQAEQLAVIAHPSTKAAGISTDALAQIYLDKAKSLPDGTPAEPIDQPEGTPQREKFYLDVTSKDERALKSYWSKRMFTGKGKPPQVLPNDREVKEYVARTPGAIGYVNGGAVDGSVKILLILP